MNILKIKPLNKKIEIPADKDLYTALKENDIFIKSTCGGCASCTHCIITILEGSENINEMSFEEKQILGNTFHITQERLSCQTKINGEVTIDVSKHGHEAKPKPKLRKKTEVDSIRQERYEKRKEKPKKLGGGKKPKPFNFRTEGEE